MANFKELGAELSNWGRWGPDDRSGTLNLVRPEHIQAAAAEVRTGKTFHLSIPSAATGLRAEWADASTRCT